MKTWAITKENLIKSVLEKLKRDILDESIPLSLKAALCKQWIAEVERIENRPDEVGEK